MKKDPMNFMMTFLPPCQEKGTSNSDTWTTYHFQHHHHLIMNPPNSRQGFSGESKHQTPSESQTALNNFKNGTKWDASVYPIFKNDKYYDTFQRSFLANLKAQGLYNVADPDHDPENGDTYEKELFK